MKKHDLEAHLSQRRKINQKSPEDLRYDAWLLCILTHQLAQMGHGTSIAAKLIDISNSRLVAMLNAIKVGRMVSIAPTTTEQIEAQISALSKLPQTAEEGRALLKKVLDAYGRDGIGTLTSLAKYLGVCRALVSRWNSELPNKLKLDILMALQALADRGLQ